jgi:hypothetical protein
MLIQIASKSKVIGESHEDDVMNYLIDKCGLNENEIAIHLTDNKTNNLKELKEYHSQVKVLIFKVAIATG